MSKGTSWRLDVEFALDGVRATATPVERFSPQREVPSQKADLAAFSLRGIATDAGVDVALIHHYFHSKEELFLATMQVPVSINELVAPLVVDGTDCPGERLVRTMLSIWDPTYRPRLWYLSAQRSPSRQTTHSILAAGHG